jgi:cupin fold WbuC family metalloprotein
MKTREQSPGILYAEGKTSVDRAMVARLAEMARRLPNRRARLCAHAGPDSPVHEMLVALAQGTYIRPHRHNDKVESYHIIEGEADLVEFDDDGRVQEVVPLGPQASGKVFYYRNPARGYHMMLLRSDTLAFVETTNGPFVQGGQEFAPWSPEEKDSSAVAEFLGRVRKDAAARPA